MLKQLVAYVGRDAFLEGARRYFKRHAYGNTRLADLLAMLDETSGRDMATWARSWLQTAGRELPDAAGDVRRGGPDHRARGPRRRAASRPELRPHRVAVGLYRRDSAGELVRYARAEVDVDRGPDGRGGAGGRGAAGTGPGQRRRPDLLQGPLRRGLAGDAARAPRRHHRPPRPRAVLVGAVESDPRRADARPGLRRPGAALRGPRDRHRRAPDAARVGRTRRSTTTPRPDGASGRAAARGGRAARSCGWPSRAASTS